MPKSTPDKFRQAQRPIASLISKSSKALQKLRPGTWQHAMLRDNLKALHLAAGLMNKKTGGKVRCTRADLQESIDAIAAMIGRGMKTKAKFPPGTAQHTLQRNRIHALRLAKAVTKAELNRKGA